ncbi:hypothetical protein OBBRIDRAFT_824944 [Obba rivulosa]|uniref:C2H2-type domain-containing protein n=1 Tax=Obba rivulosa TaxID=1052685 RepID=A0A8E2DNY7_9APHY|nr:hypothetical protein OBBRIDRAFT_824944 [Obba rivulosa]
MYPCKYSAFSAGLPHAPHGGIQLASITVQPAEVATPPQTLERPENTSGVHHPDQPQRVLFVNSTAGRTQRHAKPPKRTVIEEAGIHKHTDSKKYTCPDCGTQMQDIPSKRKRHLTSRTHMLAIHAEDAGAVCQHCGLMFARLDNLQRHLQKRRCPTIPSTSSTPQQ